MEQRPLKSKHSHNNRESREGETLRYIREARKLSLLDVANIFKVKSIEIDHFENGRKFYTDQDIEKFLECYQVARNEFDTLMKLKILNKQMVNHLLLQKKGPVD